MHAKFVDRPLAADIEDAVEFGMIFFIVVEGSLRPACQFVCLRQLFVELVAVKRIVALVDEFEPLFQNRRGPTDRTVRHQVTSIIEVSQRIAFFTSYVGDGTFVIAFRLAFTTESSQYIRVEAVCFGILDVVSADGERRFDVPESRRRIALQVVHISRYERS